MEQRVASKSKFCVVGGAKRVRSGRGQTGGDGRIGCLTTLVVTALNVGETQELHRVTQNKKIVKKLSKRGPTK